MSANGMQTAGNQGRATELTVAVMLPGAALVAFSFLYHYHRIAAIVCLSVFAVLLIIELRPLSYSRIVELFGLKKPRMGLMVLLVLLGFLMGAKTRWNSGLFPVPQMLHPFVVTAMLIGSTEELICRGYFFGRTISVSESAGLAIFLSALIHTCYKLALFLPPGGTDLVRLGIATFVAGLLLGFARFYWKSVWPCVGAHAAYDLCLYGDGPAPWWVW